MRNYYIAICIALIIGIIITLVYKSNSKEEKPQDNNTVVEDDNYIPDSLDNLITYDVLKDYKEIERYNFTDESDILREVSYDSLKDDGRFTVTIFSYKNRDVGIECEEEIYVDEYINRLTHKEQLIIDNKTFYVGYTAQDDHEDVIARAYVKNNDYVFEFIMSNFDNFITKKQYEDFIKMIKTVKFKK